MKYLIFSAILIPALSHAAVSETFRRQPECRVSGTAAICQVFNEKEDATLVCQGSVLARTADGKVISSIAQATVGPYAYEHFIVQNEKNAPLVDAKADLNCVFRQN